MNKFGESPRVLGGLLLAEINNIIWERVAVGNTAHVYSSLDFEVSLISPSDAPRVLYNPVIHTVFISKTNSKNSVVDILSSVVTDS